MITPLTVSLALLAVFLIAFMRGAFGGGFAIIGIPLLALVMDPVAAGALLAPLFIATDMVALRYWKPSTLVAARSDPAAAFARHRHRRRLAGAERARPARDRGPGGAGHAHLRGALVSRRRPRDAAAALDAQGRRRRLSPPGFPTMVAHSGGPPLAIYLLPLGLSKELYAGTTSLFFTIGNAVKAGPWLLLAQPTAEL